MKKLLDQYRLKTITLKNRLVFPAVICKGYEHDSKGLVHMINLVHYQNIARSGVGLIIVEATAINRKGRIHSGQLGLWNDAQIEGHKQLTKVIHEQNVKVMVQLNHGGLKSIYKLNDSCNSGKYNLNKGEFISKKLEEHDIQSIVNDFYHAAIRAKIAGYDGIEIHGCHGYLISQFLNKKFNTREDEYGSRGGRLVEDIYQSISELQSDDFLIGIRMGAFEPELEDGIKNALFFESLGFDFLDISYGFSEFSNESKPLEYKHSASVYGADEISKKVTIPIFAVDGIRNIKDAIDILNTSCIEMIDIARAILVDNNWLQKSVNNIDIDQCLNCTSCVWSRTPLKCRARQVSKNIRINYCDIGVDLN